VRPTVAENGAQTALPGLTRVVVKVSMTVIVQRVSNVFFRKTRGVL